MFIKIIGTYAISKNLNSFSFSFAHNNIVDLGFNACLAPNSYIAFTFIVLISAITISDPLRQVTNL